METIETTAPDGGRGPVRRPIQLPLIWSDTPEDSAPGMKAAPGANAPDAQPENMGTATERLIDAQTRKTKTVCVTLFGLALVGLHLFAS